MAENYTGKKIKDTYQSILHIGLDKNIYDGTGSRIINQGLSSLSNGSVEFSYSSSTSYNNFSLPPTFFSVCSSEYPCMIYSSGSLIPVVYNGLTIRQFPPKESPAIYSKLSSITLGNLVGISDDLQLIEFKKLKEINMPTLKYVIGNFSWVNSNELEKCYVPSLEYVGSFSPSGGSGSMHSINLPSLSGCAGDFSPVSMSCSYMNINSLHYVGGSFYPTNLNSLIDLSGSALISVGGNFNPSNCQNVQSMVFNNIQSIHGNFSPNNLPNCNIISFNKLEYVGGNFSPVSMSIMIDEIGNQFSSVKFIESNLDLHGLVSCSSVSFNALETISGSCMVSNMDNLLIISQQSLISIADVCSILNNNVLTTLELPVIQHIGNGLICTGCSNLSDVMLGNTLKYFGGNNFIITGASLSPNSIENILHILSTLDGNNGTTLFGSGKTIDLSGGGSSGISALTITASAARDVLLARGIVVTLNP